MKNILFLLFAFVLWGCIEDNGNYDYNPSRDLIVEDVPGNITLTVGESVTLTPKPMVRYDKTKTIIEGVEYEWVLEGEVVSREPSFTYTAQEYGNFEGILRIKDPLTKSMSFWDFRFDVETQYKSGFLVLSEENGKAQLSMIRAKWSRTPSDTIVYEGEWKNVYETENGGESIIGRPLSLTEHWAYDDDMIQLGEVTIVTEVDGKLKIQELNGFNFKRETYIEQEFKDEKLPVNYNPKVIMHTCFDSFLLDESGDVYMRRSSVKNGYHTGYFADNIKLWNGQKFSDLIFTQYEKTSAVLAIEKDAEGKRNYVGIYSSSFREHDNLTRLELIGSYADDFKDIQGEVIWSDWRDRRSPCPPAAF